jgi:hypothetical protein
MLPGFTILVAAATAHPSKFKVEYLSNSLYLIAFAAVAILVGNTWYVFHRYSLHQLIDWIMYWRMAHKWKGYRDWLASHIYDSCHLKAAHNRVQEHTQFRSAQIIFMFITCEVALLFSFGADPCSFFARHPCTVRIVAATGFTVAIIQYWIGFYLDVDFVKRGTSQDQRVTNA